MTVDISSTDVVYVVTNTAIGTQYPIPFPYLCTEDVQAYLGNELDHIDLVQGIDYSITGAIFTALTTFTLDSSLVIYRDTARTQNILWVDGQAIYPPSVMAADDKLTFIVQELADSVKRTVAISRELADQGLVPEDILTAIETASAAAVDAAYNAAARADAAAAEAVKAAASATQAGDYATQSGAYAAQSKADADRAASLVDPVTLASSVYNVRKAFVVPQTVYAGNTLELPGFYFPTRDVLYLVFESVLCTPILPMVEPYGEYQYTEVGTDPNTASNQVTLHFTAEAGTVFDMWVVSSAAGKNISEIEALVAQAEEWAYEASAYASMAENTKDEITVYATGAIQEMQVIEQEVEAHAAAVPDITVALDGQVLVARGIAGVMTAQYENAPSAAIVRQQTHLASDLPAGAEFTVPIYIVGAAKLAIYMDGLLCEYGSSSAATYKENGSVGAESITISFYDTLLSGTSIIAVATA